MGGLQISSVFVSLKLPQSLACNACVSNWIINSFYEKILSLLIVI